MNTHSYAGLEISGGDNGDGAALLSKLPFKTLLHRHWKKEQKNKQVDQEVVRVIFDKMHKSTI